MRGLSLLFAAVTVAPVCSSRARAAATVAITVDDLPYVLPEANVAVGTSAVERINLNLLAAFQAHRVPVTGFVIQKRVESLGPTSGNKDTQGMD